MRMSASPPFKPWAIPFLVVFVAWLWWRAALDALRAIPATEIPLDPRLLAGLSVAGKLAGHAVEAGWYVACGRGFGDRPGFGRLAVAIVMLSMCDLFRLAMLEPAAGGGFDPRVLLTGAELLARDRAARNGLSVAFGSFGLLVALRLAGTAWWFARETGSRWGRAALVVGCTWLATRLATWWTADLARGLSPLGPG